MPARFAKIIVCLSSIGQLHLPTAPARARGVSATTNRTGGRRAAAIYALIQALAHGGASIHGTGARARRTSQLKRLDRTYTRARAECGRPHLHGIGARARRTSRRKRLDRTSSRAPPEKLPALARELVDAKVNVIVAIGDEAIVAAKNATRTIPIAMVACDAVTSGFVAPRRGGNSRARRATMTDRFR